MSDEHKYRRAETGSIQFGDDWPGVFIRGDNAMYYAMQLQMLLDGSIGPDDFITKTTLEGLARLLSGCHAHGDLKDLQLLKAFPECLAKKK